MMMSPEEAACGESARVIKENESTASTDSHPHPRNQHQTSNGVEQAGVVYVPTSENLETAEDSNVSQLENESERASPRNRILSRCLAKVRFILTCGCCTCPAVWWLKVRHLQIVLVSMLASLTAVASNIETVVVVMSTEYIRTGYHWSRVQQTLIESSYFLGCAIMNFGNGFYVAGLDKKFLVCGIYLSASFLTALTPFSVRMGGFFLFVAIRIAIGCLMGSVLPILHWFIIRWSIRKEIVMGYAMAFSGTYMGHFISLLLVMTTYHKKIYWDVNFYAFATYGACAVITWMLLGSKHPNECPYISTKEQDLINSKRLAVSEDLGRNIPWKEMTVNVPLIALIVAESCYRMLCYILLTQTPIYFLEVYDYPIWKTGLVSALPHLIIWISCYPVGYMVGLFIRADIVSVTAARKFCVVLGGVAMIFMGILNSLLGSVTMYTTSLTLGMYYLMGGHINHVDLSPRYSVLLLGVVRGAGNLSAILSNIVKAVVVKELSSHRQWSLLFRIIGSISAIGGLVYLLFGVAEKQKFNNLPPTTDSDDYVLDHSPATLEEIKTEFIATDELIAKNNENDLPLSTFLIELIVRKVESLIFLPAASLVEGTARNSENGQPSSTTL